MGVLKTLVFTKNNYRLKIAQSLCKDCEKE